MLTIATYVNGSSLHGLGVFCAEPVQEGQAVWVHHPSVDLCFSADQWEQMRQEVHPKSMAELVKRSVKSDGLYHLSIDNAQYMNHSAQPNISFVDSELETMVALRDLQPDEEILCDYYEYSDPDCLSLRLVRNIEPPG